MPGPQNKKQKGKSKANSQIAHLDRTVVVPIAANTLNTVGPVVSTVSTAAGYSWSVNVTGTMIAANIGSAFSFAANTLNFWGARNDYSARRSKMAEEIAAMPEIRDSGIESVVFVKEDMPMAEGGYYFYKDQSEDIWVAIRNDKSELHSIPLTINGGGLEQNSPVLLHLLLPIIYQELESLSDDESKPINGKLGIALAYLIETLPEANLSLASTTTLSEEKKGWLTENTHYIVYISQIICLGACAAAAIAYGAATARSNTSTAETSDGSPNDYIDPILPLGYISASIALQSIGYCISTFGINSQNQKKAQIEKEYSDIRADRDKLQVTSNQKQKIKESIAYFSLFKKQVQGTGQRCLLLLGNVNTPDLLKTLILKELSDFLEVLNLIHSKFKSDDLSESVSFEMAEVKDALRDLSDDINKDEISSMESLTEEITKISERVLCSITNHIKITLGFQEEQTHANERAIDSEFSVHVQYENSSHRLNV